MSPPSRLQMSSTYDRNRSVPDRAAIKTAWSRLGRAGSLRVSPSDAGMKRPGGHRPRSRTYSLTWPSSEGGVAMNPPPEAGTTVIFATGRASVDSELKKAINSFLDIWNDIRMTKRAETGDPIEVHGYASLTGPPAVSWDLSCRRAEAVRAALQARMAAQRWPLPEIDVLAHGPTDLFDPAPLRNQRAVIGATKPDDYRGIVSKPPAGTFGGLAARKSALVTSGGNLLDLAVAMLETETMDAHEYPDKDDKPQGDAACFGIFKQNWGLI